MTKDLKATVEKATEAKESLIATQSELSLEQSKNASMLANSTQLNEELVNLRGKTKEQVTLVMDSGCTKVGFGYYFSILSRWKDGVSGILVMDRVIMTGTQNMGFLGLDHLGTPQHYLPKYFRE